VSSPFHGASIPEPEFAGDDGSADPELAAVLRLWWTGQASGYEVVECIHGKRLMVPVVAVADEVELNADGHAQEKSSHMATVTLVQPDGRRGLLAFTSMASLNTWDPQARGIPAEVGRVAQAAIAEQADAVLLDVAGPVLYALTEPALSAVAEGRVWVRPHTDPEILTCIGEVAARTPGLASHDVIDGSLQKLDVLIMLEIAPGAHPDAVAQTLLDELEKFDLVQRRCSRGVGIGVRGLTRPQ
jgi:hypothetical protein